MTKTQPDVKRCIVLLVRWLLITQFVVLLLLPAEFFTGPSSDRPIAILFAIVILSPIPIGAFHAAKYARGTGLLFTVYGWLGSIAIWMHFLHYADVGSLIVVRGDVEIWRQIILACFWTVGLIVTSRLAASLRCRLARTSRFPPGQCTHCSYDLTGNVSGVCPECGAPRDT